MNDEVALDILRAATGHDTHLLYGQDRWYSGIRAIAELMWQRIVEAAEALRQAAVGSQGTEGASGMVSGGQAEGR